MTLQSECATLYLEAFYRPTVIRRQEVIMSRGKLDQPIMLYVTENMKIDIDTYSERMFMNKSQFIRQALDNYISGLTFSPDE